MTNWPHITRAFRRDTRGTALVELAIVLPLFLLLMFGVLEYGRLFWNSTMSQKAMQMAARLATVGPPLCAGVPTVHEITDPPPANTQYGTLCRGTGVCATVAAVSCTLSNALDDGVYDGTYADRVWTSIEPLLPPGSSPSNVQFTYSQDPDLGFLGGPYTPVVTAELVNVNFDFVLPIGGLAALAANDPTLAASTPNSISIPAMSTSVPGEDLDSGAGD
ncbi:hypothetical protein AVO45_16600 [Ruegeria marisrubri]|uniref:TadE-like domain-containing protein n=1 Tax=Ruegeria marisrubri TaxID=1685379 RepID=A0A0X3UBA1_9RHOB|nr:TadE/TadG family type IV pilus assembly protein [Ruegeria marisrubri]KUJ85367.1 hypothetical protein AVO45_16600 [Ruegeria marisrubri]